MIATLSVATFGGSARATTTEAAPRVATVATVATDGTVAWSVSSVADREDGTRRPLRSTPWHVRLPVTTLSIIAGEDIPLADVRRPVLLDFWASWCQPCLVELPELQALLDTGLDASILAVAVNVDETDAVALAAARRLGVRMPVGRMNPALRDLARIRALPTLILADAQGRVTHRWDGYAEGLEHEVETAVRALLAGETPLEPVEVGTVVEGADRVRVAWFRESKAAAEGVAVFDFGGGRERVVSTVGGALAAIELDGRYAASVEAPAEMGRIAVGDATGDGRPDLVGYRRGSERLAVLDMKTRDRRALVAPGPVRGVAVDRDGDVVRIVVATPEGLFVTRSAGRPWERLADGSVRDVGLDASGSLWALEQGRVRAIGSTDGAPGATIDVPAGVTRFAVAADGASVVVASGFEDLVTLAGPVRLVAAVAADGLVDVRNASNGEPVARVRVEAVRHAIGADVDRDGRDELLLATASGVLALAFVP